MRGFYAAISLWATLSLIVPSAFAGANDQSEKTIPQGQDPPGADNGEPLPPAGDKEVIPPPPTGDEDIYTDAPSPDAGHEKEVIPAPEPESEPNRTRPMIAR